MLELTGIKRNVQPHSYTLISKENIGGLISGDPSYHGCPSDLRTHGRGEGARRVRAYAQGGRNGKHP